MTSSRPRSSVSDRLAAATAAALVGRYEERARLTALLEPNGPAVVFVHGPGGIGKTTLVTGTLAALPLNCLHLDGRRLEPTESGALAGLGAALGGRTPVSAQEAAEQIAAVGIDVVVLDSFERLNLLDGWLRNELAQALPASATTLLVGRRGPNVAWRTAPGWRSLVAELVVGPMTETDVKRLLAGRGIAGDDADRIRRFARGHPLAVVVAGEALARTPGLPLGSGAPAEVVEELFAVLLEDLEPAELAVTEAAAVLRRVTVPLLAAVLDEPEVERSWQILRELPFTVTTSSGVGLSGVAAPVLLEALELRDPTKVRLLRTRAARAILDRPAGPPDWETTADLLHLVQNPLIRNAYAPPGMLQHPAERAGSDDRQQVRSIAARWTGEDSARLADRWWQDRRDAFTVVRASDGSVAAFSVTALVDASTGSAGWDPVMQAVASDLTDNPLAPGDSALVFRWSLGRRQGERPTPELATLVIDLKRTYLQQRAALRRVYTAVRDWQEAAPVLRVMGFDRLCEVPVAEEPVTLARLDFGVGGVDAWIGRHVLAEDTAPDVGPGSTVFCLTAREHEVLALLANGLTNAQLAGALFISERTANRHVSNIFSKLGVHNRTQAARVAVAAGLAG